LLVAVIQSRPGHEQKVITNRSVLPVLGLDNPIHVLFLLAILLLLFGAKRLPEIGSSLGAGIRGFKESITGETPPAQLKQAAAPPVGAAASAPAVQHAAEPHAQ